MNSAQIAPGLARIDLGVVNAYRVSEPSGRWFLVDTGFPGRAEKVRRVLDALGVMSPPEHILLTHAHLDHAGGARSLARAWGVPVYIHPLDIAYARGRGYPRPDPTVGGALAMVTRFNRGPSTAYVGEAATLLPGRRNAVATSPSRSGSGRMGRFAFPQLYRIPCRAASSWQHSA